MRDFIPKRQQKLNKCRNDPFAQLCLSGSFDDGHICHCMDLCRRGPWSVPYAFNLVTEQCLTSNW